jgi:acyl carrier protein
MASIRPTSDQYAIEADVFLWNDRKQPKMQLIGIRFDGFASNKQVSSVAPAVASQAIQNVPSQQLTATKLLALPEGARLPALQEHLRQQLANELEISGDKLLLDQPLSDFGIDSLIVFRLGIQLESEFGFSLNSRAMMQGQSLGALSESLLWRLTNLTSDEEKGTQSSVLT